VLAVPEGGDLGAWGIESVLAVCCASLLLGALSLPKWLPDGSTGVSAVLPTGVPAAMLNRSCPEELSTAFDKGEV